MAYFVLRLNPPRPTFPFDASERELSLMGEHAEYWQGKTEVGTAIAVGPVFDPSGSWGLALVEVDDAEAAEALTYQDPIIRAEAGFTYEVLPVPSLLLRGGQ